MASVKFEHVYKVYPGGVRAITDLNLEIKDKEFVVFVGPSGCGKSTTLRMIAGLEDISAGNLYIDGIRVNDLPPSKRDITMVFQNYALYPHKTVYENMAFGLRMAKVPREEIDARIKNAAKILGLEPYLSRKPRALSGGQRQRVALGRSIVREPKVFLLDEPLSNLDAKLRVQMRSEISKLHRRLGITFVYVTHDQTEAMTMGTQIVVMKDGVIQQVDTPTNLYDHPSNVFVATFLGTPQMNLFDGVLQGKGDDLEFVITSDDAEYRIPLGERVYHLLESKQWVGKACQLGLRPEDIVIDEENKQFELNIDMIEKLGAELVLHCYLKGSKIPVTVKGDGRLSVKEGESIGVRFLAGHVHLFAPGKEGKRIAGLLCKNHISCQLDPTKGTVKAAGMEFALPSESLSCLIPEYAKEKKTCALEISSDAFHLRRRDEGDLAFEARLKEVEERKDGAIAFFSLDGSDSYLGAKFPLSPGKAGDKIALYVRKEDATLVDETHSFRLLARHQYTTNIVPAEVKAKGEKRILRFASFSLLAPSDFEPGLYNLEIPYDAFLKIPSNKKKARGKRKLSDLIKLGFGKLSSKMAEAKKLKSLPKQEAEALIKKKKEEKALAKEEEKARKEKIKALRAELKGKTFRLHPVNEDHIGSATILYANVKGFADYLTIKGDKDDSCFAERHPAYALDYSKIKLMKR